MEKNNRTTREVVICQRYQSSAFQETDHGFTNMTQTPDIRTEVRNEENVNDYFYKKTIYFETYLNRVSLERNGQFLNVLLHSMFYHLVECLRLEGLKIHEFHRLLSKQLGDNMGSPAGRVQAAVNKLRRSVRYVVHMIIYN